MGIADNRAEAVAIAEALRWVPDGHPAPDRPDPGLVFSDHGQPLNLVTFTRRVNEEAKRLGLPPIGSHGFRHSLATNMLRERTGDILEVSDRLGHAATAFTMDRYAHVQDEHRKDVARRVSAMYGL